MNVRKHWRSALLVLTSVFWASCNEESSVAAPVETNPNPESSAQNDVSAASRPESSAVGAASAESKPESAPSAESSSSSIKKISCELESICPDYGIDTPCSSYYRCDDDKICTSFKKEVIKSPICTGNICPEYGVEYNIVEGMQCDETFYTLEEFTKLYDIKK